MIAFGGLVAGLLVVRPRGLVDEALVARLGALLPRRASGRPPPAASGSAVARVFHPASPPTPTSTDTEQA
ncbi:hypothetical protein [Burkholderia glumae]|nr:hypothetical protein [Burkholderia glumae]